MSERDDPPADFLAADSATADSEGPPLSEVSTTVPMAANGRLDLHTDDVKAADIQVRPIREPSNGEDVSLEIPFTVGTVSLGLSEDDALAMMDAIHNALEVDSFDE